MIFVRSHHLSPWHVAPHSRGTAACKQEPTLGSWLFRTPLLGVGEAAMICPACNLAVFEQRVRENYYHLAEGQT